MSKRERERERGEKRLNLACKSDEPFGKRSIFPESVARQLYPIIESFCFFSLPRPPPLPADEPPTKSRKMQSGRRRQLVASGKKKREKERERKEANTLARENQRDRLTWKIVKGKRLSLARYIKATLLQLPELFPSLYLRGLVSFSVEQSQS